VFGDYILVEASTDLDGGKTVLNYKKKETDFYLILSPEGWYFCTVGQHGYAAMKDLDCHLFHPDTSCDIAPEKGWKYSVVSKNGILWVSDPNIRVVPQNPPSEGYFTCPPVGCHYVDGWKEAPCSKTCGGGHYNRYRHLNNSLGVRGLHCQNVIYEKLPCNQQPCPDTTIIVTISACAIICVLTLCLGLYLYKKKYSKLDTSSFGIANNLVELKTKNEDP